MQVFAKSCQQQLVLHPGGRGFETLSAQYCKLLSRRDFRVTLGGRECSKNLKILRTRTQSLSRNCTHAPQSHPLLSPPSREQSRRRRCLRRLGATHTTLIAGRLRTAKTRQVAEFYLSMIVPIKLRLRQVGASLREIAVDLDRRGIKTRQDGYVDSGARVYRNYRWNASQVRRILKWADRLTPSQPVEILQRP